MLHIDPVSPDASTPPSADAGSLERGTLAALDDLLTALTLDRTGPDRFRAHGEGERFDRVFGGQVVAQALLAASATVDGKQPDSLHAYFVEAGVPGQPVDVLVERIRDGRSISTRRVTVLQGSRQQLVAILSFHAGAREPELAQAAPSDPGPDGLPLLQDWVRHFSAQTLNGLSWIEHPPPLELRMGEPPNFMGGPNTEGTRTHWMRLPRQVGDDPLLHAALLAYASDYLLLDMVLRAYPDRAALGVGRLFQPGPLAVVPPTPFGWTDGIVTPRRLRPSPAIGAWCAARSAMSRAGSSPARCRRAWCARA